MKVSVIVPTYRRPRRIHRCLQALAQLEYPRDSLEVVVVEDCEPLAELDELRARSFGDLRVLWSSQAHAGPSAARNHGARIASGRLLAFTDDDCRPRPGWLAALVQRQEGKPDRIVGGHTLNAVHRNPFSSASQALVAFITDDGRRRKEAFFASNNLVLERATFLKLGGFDDTFPLAAGEDRDFCRRSAEAGLEFVHVPEARVEHDHELTFAGFLRQHFRYGRGAYRFQRALTRRTGETLAQRFDWRFHVGLVLAPLREATGPRAVLVSGLLALSQVPNVLGFLAERRAIRRLRSPESQGIFPARGTDS